MIARWITVGMCCWGGTAALAAQNPDAATAQRSSTSEVVAPRPSTPTFRSGVELVSLTVTVTDRHERFLSGLTAGDFRVFEDGVRQPLTFFAAESVPLDLAILIDGSASMREKMAIVTPAAIGLARTLRPQDRAMVVEFRDNVILRQDLTGDVGAIERAISTIRPTGGTSLYNAISVALNTLEGRKHDTGEIRRQAVVVISDGEDTTSLIDYEDMLDRARRAEVTIYPIALRSELDQLRERTLGRGGTYEASFAMRDLARQTGGQAFFPAAVEELNPVYAAIADELGHQYALGYQPQNARRDGAWRQVSVQVPTRPGVQPRTRTGYFAASGARDLLSTLRDLARRSRP